MNFVAEYDISLKNRMLVTFMLIKKFLSFAHAISSSGLKNSSRVIVIISCGQLVDRPLGKKERKASSFDWNLCVDPKERKSENREERKWLKGVKWDKRQQHSCAHWSRLSRLLDAKDSFMQSNKMVPSIWPCTKEQTGKQSPTLPLRRCRNALVGTATKPSEEKVHVSQCKDASEPYTKLKSVPRMLVPQDGCCGESLPTAFEVFTAATW
ncbi:hypothetical protein EVAR_72411_1 [Eumeta japonica]|uniref:Uncharacterized protein n=1 Tax=Eumeta variegata TaxID=151549 RepID=A0A4C1SVU5_EUMVA|nr:hypothetical protein EVAR_72411_1 [Eumeta japonica]